MPCLVDGLPFACVDFIGIYVMRVESVPSGFYLLRRGGGEAPLSAAPYAGPRPDGLAADFPLFLIKAAPEAEVAEAAKKASCQQVRSLSFLPSI